MIEDIVKVMEGESLSQSEQKPSRFNPSVFQHELALKADWFPLQKGGHPFRTHQLEQTDEKVTYKLMPLTILLGIIMILAGIIIPTMMYLDGDTTSQLSPFGVFLIVEASAAFLIYTIAMPVVFDFKRGYFYRGYLSKGDMAQQKRVKEYCKIEDIAAIQLVSELCSTSTDESGNKRGYKSFETNLVLKDGKRLHLIDHPNKELTITEAEELADLLQVPLWNSIDMITYSPKTSTSMLTHLKHLKHLK